MNINNIPILKITLLEDDGIEQISFVEDPAMEEQWKLFSKENVKQDFTNDDEMIIYYPVIVADKPIYRNTPFEHFVVFSKDEIKKIRNKFFKDNKHNMFNENHGPVKIDGAYVVESWIKQNDNDKSVSMGFDVNDHSWFVGIKIDNKEYWNEKVKKGKFSGLSMEAFYGLDISSDIILEKYTKSLLSMDLSDDVLKSVLSDILRNIEKK